MFCPSVGASDAKGRINSQVKRISPRSWEYPYCPKSNKSLYCALEKCVLI